MENWYQRAEKQSKATQVSNALLALAVCAIAAVVGTYGDPKSVGGPCIVLFFLGFIVAIAYPTMAYDRARAAEQRREDEETSAWDRQRQRNRD